MFNITGNETCDRLINIDFNGNVLHSLWFKTITKENGKADLVAINILADIVYWYRPIQVRDEETGKVIGYRKKFKADLLQRNYDSYADQFGLSKRQVTDAFIRLEKLGIVKRVFRTLCVNGMLVNNVLHIDLDIDGLVKYSTEDAENMTFVTPVPKKRERGHEKTWEVSRKNGIALTKKSDSYPEKKGDLPRKNVTPLTSNEETNTKNTTEITTKITTKNNNKAILPDENVKGVEQQEDAVVELLKKIGMAEIKAVELISFYGAETVRQKLYILSLQKCVDNPVGFIVQALKDDYVDVRLEVAEQERAVQQEIREKNKKREEMFLQQEEMERVNSALSELEDRPELARRKAATFQGTFCIKYRLLFNREHPKIDDPKVSAMLEDIFVNEVYHSKIRGEISVPNFILRDMLELFFKTACQNSSDYTIWGFLSDEVFSAIAVKCLEKQYVS